MYFARMFILFGSRSGADSRQRLHGAGANAERQTGGAAATAEAGWRRRHCAGRAAPHAGGVWQEVIAHITRTICVQQHIMCVVQD